MTLKKSKRGKAIKGQSIFEYFILTTAVVAVVLFFASTPYFKNIKASCETAFDSAVGQILESGQGQAYPANPANIISDGNATFLVSDDVTITKPFKTTLSVEEMNALLEEQKK